MFPRLKYLNVFIWTQTSYHWFPVAFNPVQWIIFSDKENKINREIKKQTNENLHIFILKQMFLVKKGKRISNIKNNKNKMLMQRIVTEAHQSQF